MERKLSPHDLLTNLILGLSLPVTTSENPVGINGLLKRKFGYHFDIKTYRDNYESIFTNDLKPSDGFLNNPEKKTSMTLECKSYLEDEDTKFRKQLLFYSNSEEFKEVFVTKDFNHEILVVVFNEPELIANAIRNVEEIQNQGDLKSNVVIWAVQENEDATYHVSKVWGNHIFDDSLEKLMVSNGLVASPIRSVLLFTPETPQNHQVGEIAIRLLILRASSNNLEISVESFVGRQEGDCTLPEKKLRSLVKTALRIIPSIGEFSNGSIIFKKNPRLGSIHEQISELFEIDLAEYKRRLQNLSTPTRKKEEAKEQQSLPEIFEKISQED